MLGDCQIPTIPCIKLATADYSCKRIGFAENFTLFKDLKLLLIYYYPYTHAQYHYLVEIIVNNKRHFARVLCQKPYPVGMGYLFIFLLLQPWYIHCIHIVYAVLSTHCIHSVYTIYILYTLCLYCLESRDVQAFNIMGRIATWNISMSRRTY